MSTSLKEDIRVLIFILVACIVLSLVVLDGLLATKKTVNGTVIDIIENTKHYTLVLRTNKDELDITHATQEYYGTTYIGEFIQYQKSKGFFTGLVWAEKIIKK